MASPSSRSHAYDVLVVGGGNAGLVSALSAQELGARVAILECAPHAERGGNSRFAGSIFRIVHNGLPDIEPLLCESAKADIPRCRFGPYTWDAYEKDMMRTTKGLCDREQMEVMFRHSYETVKWMKEKGVQWQLTLGKFFDEETIAKGGVFDMVAGGVLMAKNEGDGLMDDLWRAVESCTEPKIDIYYSTPACDLLVNGDTVSGVRTRLRGEFVDFTGQVVLACGGFEASARLRRQYLGEGWDLVVVRGTRFNTGTMLEKAIAAGCGNTGHWGGCHASPQDLGAPRVGDLSVTDKMSRYSYPFSIMINQEGNRFMDEGENNFGLTYAKTGAAIGKQSNATAFEIHDQKTLHLLEPRYSSARAIYTADTLEELGKKMDVNVQQFCKTVEDYNAATMPGEFDPMHLDGVSTGNKLVIPKTNWALPIDQGPYVAYGVTCGITFTYAGLKTDTAARVLNNEGLPMPGLWGVGEISGGFFAFNYPGGSGLPKGAVFGRIAGQRAALEAKKLKGTSVTGKSEVNGCHADHEALKSVPALIKGKPAGGIGGENIMNSKRQDMPID